MPKSKFKEDTYTELKNSFTDAVIESLTSFANNKGGRAISNANVIAVDNIEVGELSVKEFPLKPVAF